MTDLSWSEVQGSLRLDDVESALDLDVREVGGEHWCPCPLPDHPGLDESGNHFSIQTDKLLWNCFVCGEGGNIPQLVMAIQGCDFKSALNWLVRFSDADVSNDTENFIKQLEGLATRPKMEPYERGNGVLPWYPHDAIANHLEWLRGGYEATERLLLDKWGVGMGTAIAWHLGYDPEHQRGEYTGPALIIPHYFAGELRGWQERWLQDDRPKKLPKYTNTTGFPRSNTIFGWDRVDGRRHKIVVVESVMTVIRLWQEGIPAIATFGGKINAYQRRLLMTCARGIIYAPDEGEVGEKATRGVLSTLAKHISVEIARPADEEKADLADLTTAEILERLADATPAFLA